MVYLPRSNMAELSDIQDDVALEKEEICSTESIRSQWQTDRNQGNERIGSREKRLV